MKVREYHSQLELPVPPGALFSFFADARNLNAITPPWVHFRMISAPPVPLREGALIDYRLRVHGMPLRWRTRISAWEPPFRFVDEQLRGPYRLWVHTHTFTPRAGGTLVDDHVRYAVPFDLLLHRWFVQPDVEKIFRFRAEALRVRFANAETNLPHPLVKESL